MGLGSGFGLGFGLAFGLGLEGALARRAAAAAAGHLAGIPGPPVEAVVLAVADGTTDAREEVHAHV